MRCLHCGAFITKKKAVPLSDGEICQKCFQSFGYRETEYPFVKHIKYDEIKKGKEALQKEATVKSTVGSISVRIKSASERPDVNATAAEVEVFEILCEMTGRDMRLTRTSDNYVQAQLGTWSFARFKFTPNAAWIAFPPLNSRKKNPLDTPDDVRELGRKVDAALVVVEENS